MGVVGLFSVYWLAEGGRLNSWLLSLKYGSVADWLLIIVAAVGLLLTRHQLKHLTRERET